MTAERHTLAEIIKNTVLSQAKREGMAHVFIARPEWQFNIDLPGGMSITRKPLRGSRVPTHGRRSYGSTFTIEATWPKDNLHALRVPRFLHILNYPIEIQIADYVVHCYPGHSILIPAGIPFTHHFDRPSLNFEMLLLSPYQGGMLCWHVRRWWDAEDKPQVREQTCSIPQSQAMFYLDQLMDESTAQREEHDTVCESLFRIVFSLLYRELQQLPILHTGSSLQAAHLEQRDRMAHAVQKAEEYIKRNLRDPLSIDKVARYVYMSRTVFTAQFHAKTGKSFTRYVQDLRFDAACTFLREGDLGIHHVAAAVGLKPDRMRVLFQEREGVSPLEYRRRCRRASSER